MSIKQKIFSTIYRMGFKTIGNSRIARSPLVAKLGNDLKNQGKTDFIEIDGRKMYLDENDTFALSLNKIWEPKETELIKNRIKKGDIVVDVGANIGYYTLLFAQLVGLKGKVFAFEPDPTNFELLKKNVMANKYNNVELIQKAVSNNTKQTQLYIAKEGGAMNRIFDAGLDDTEGSLQIETVTFDEYFGSQKINFIKIDVEGSEIGVLQGMKTHLQFNTEILCEFYPYLITRSGLTPSKFLDLLIDNGYVIHDIEKNPAKQVDKDELLKRYNVNNKDDHTYIHAIKI